jgi:hypothetical protein
MRESLTGPPSKFHGARDMLLLAPGLRLLFGSRALHSVAVSANPAVSRPNR